MQPPLLPEETALRVYQRARRDSIMILVLSAAFSLAAATSGDRIGVAAGLLAAAAAGAELHGSHLLRDGFQQAMRWLIWAQAGLLLVVLAYCAVRLLTFDPVLAAKALAPQLRDRLLSAGYTPDGISRMIRYSYWATYLLTGLATLLYQGGMIRYYIHRWQFVDRALTAKEE